VANSSQDSPKKGSSPLTDSQLNDLQRALDGSDQQSQDVPRTLSESQISALKAEVDKYRAAQRQVADAMGVLWNAQLDMAINLGEASRIEDALLGLRAFMDNCSCGGGGGASCW